MGLCLGTEDGDFDLDQAGFTGDDGLDRYCGVTRGFEALALWSTQMRVRLVHLPKCITTTDVVSTASFCNPFLLTQRSSDNVVHRNYICEQSRNAPTDARDQVEVAITFAPATVKTRGPMLPVEKSNPVDRVHGSV